MKSSIAQAKLLKNPLAELAAVNALKINHWAAEYYDLSWEINALEYETSSKVSPWAAWAEDVMINLLDSRTDDCRKPPRPADVIQPVWRKPLIATDLDDYDKVPETTPSPSSILAAQLAKPVSSRRKEQAVADAARAPTRLAPEALKEQTHEDKARAERAVDSFFFDLAASTKQQEEEAEEAEFIVASPTSPASIPTDASPSSKVQYFYFMDDDADDVDDDASEHGDSCQCDSAPVPEPMTLKDLIDSRAAEISGEFEPGMNSNSSPLKCSGRDRTETGSTQASAADFGPATETFIVVDATDESLSKNDANETSHDNKEDKQDQEAGGSADGADDWMVVREDAAPHFEWTVVSSDDQA